MDKTIAVTVFSLLALGAAEIDPAPPVTIPGERVERVSPLQMPGEQQGAQKLLLNAFGTRQPGPGQVRIPIPVDGAMYEVIIAKPGLARSIPAGK